MQTQNDGYTHASGKIGVFAVGLLAATPARVAEDVDVGGPESETLVAFQPVLGVFEMVMFGACLVRYHIECFIHGLVVEGGGHTYGLREDGGQSGASHAMQCFVPPVVGGNTQSVNGG